MREIVAKNILDYSIAKKINKTIHDANALKHENMRALKERNEKKLDEWTKKAEEQHMQRERERRQVMKKHKCNDQKK